MYSVWMYLFVGITWKKIIFCYRNNKNILFQTKRSQKVFQLLIFCVLVEMKKSWEVTDSQYKILSLKSGCDCEEKGEKIRL